MLVTVSSLHERRCACRCEGVPSCCSVAAAFSLKWSHFTAPPVVSVSKSKWAEPAVSGQVALRPCTAQSNLAASQAPGRSWLLEYLIRQAIALEALGLRARAVQRCFMVIISSFSGGKKWLFLLGWRDKVKLSWFSRISILDRIFVRHAFSYCGS